MEEFEPKKKIKIFTKEFYIKYSYVFIIALVLFLGTSFGLTFFTQNLNIASGSLTTAPLNVTLTDTTINATGLTVPTTNQEGLSEYVKQVTITNNGTTDGKVKLTLERTSGLNLTDMSYALVVNGAIQVIDDVPNDGVILETAIMGNEVLNVELRLWPKTTYTGSVTTFVGEIDSEIRYLGEKASNRSNLTNSYVNFNCSGNTCETWRIVGVSSERLVLTRNEDLEGASSRVDSGKYNPSLSFNDNSMITSVSTDNKNVYLAKTVKINGGDGSQSNPYKLINNIGREPDKKIIATITYKDDNNTTVGTQYIYYNETNYISQELSDSGFQGWTDGTNDYSLGDIINFTTDTILTAKVAQTLKNKIMSLCNDSNVAYVEKYNATQNGAAIDTPDGSGNEDVCFYTTTSTSNRNSDAEQNSNVIFGDYCWQIVRTTADGGVKLLYNGPKTLDNKCPSDADTANYSSNPRPTSIGVVGTYGTQNTTMSGNKLYGTSFEIYDDNGTNKFRLKNTNTYNWSDSTYQNIIGKYTCLNTSDTCTTLYYVGHYQSATQASTEQYTIGTNAHYSQIGKSSYNAWYDSPALVGYMYGDVYRVTDKSFSASSNVIERSSGSMYYYGDMAVWVIDHYELRINTGTDAEPIYTNAPSSTTTWADIRASAGGKYTCKSSSSTTGTSCTTVYYIVANSTDSYMYSVPLSNNENKDKQVTWTYGTGITKSGNTYILTGTNTLTFKLADWYTDYADSKYKNIYVCDDFTSTTCTTARFIASTSNYRETHVILNYTYYFANDIYYDSNTNTYSYDTNGTIVEVYDWYHQYNTLNSNHYMCENYDSVNNTCGANNPMYYINYTDNTQMYYAILEGVPNIETALVNMLSKDTIENSQVVTANRYNSAIKGVIDSWYENNLSSLSSYLDNNAVYCNDRTITSLGSWSKIGSTTSDYDLRFKYYNSPSKTNATLTCSNVTDRFSKTNEKALLTYPVGLLSEAERAMMYSGYARTGQEWWLGSPYNFGYYTTVGRTVAASGFNTYYSVGTSRGLRPAIVLKPGVEIEGLGTYDEPYVVKTTS